MSTTTLNAPIVAGNVYDKYGTRNPIAAWLMQGFMRSMEELVKVTRPRQVHEVGCGEGHLSSRLVEWLGVPVRGSDVSPEIIDVAQNAHGAVASFQAKSIYDLRPEVDAAELVVCAEVLEHVDDPRQALSILTGLARPYCVLSVPREPLWRALNMARGKYVRDLGNTPGHVNHWSKAGFCRLVSEFFDIQEVRSPLPWTMVLARTKGNAI